MQTNQVVAVSNSMNGQDELVIRAARYGWAEDIWSAPTGLQGGAKDVTDIVRGLVRNNELHVNTAKERQYMSQQFWPETASGPPIPRKLAVSYSYGVNGRVQTVETPEAVALRITQGKGSSSSEGQISAEEFQGCWFWIVFGVGWCGFETRRAEGRDTLVHEGFQIPFCCCPYSVPYDRMEEGRNKFKQRNGDDKFEYGDIRWFTSGRYDGAGWCTVRCSKCNMKTAPAPAPAPAPAALTSPSEELILPEVENELGQDSAERAGAPRRPAAGGAGEGEARCPDGE